MRTLALLLLLAAPCSAAQQTVRFNTADGCALEAWYSAPSTGAYVFVETHGLGSGKGEWGPLHDELKKRGWGWLTLDLRGHGASASCGGKKADYRAFTARDWRNASRDIEAAAGWLAKKNIKPGQMIFCGASVGANLSLKAAAEGRLKPAALILLSPGLEYATIRAGEYLASSQPRLLISAAREDQYAWESSNYLAAAAARQGVKAAFLEGRGGHGVNMFGEPGYMARLLDWISGK